MRYINLRFTLLTLLYLLCVATTTATAVVHCTVDWCCGLWIGLLYSYYLLIAERVKIIRWMFLLLTAGSLQHHTILQNWKWFMVVRDSLHSSIATYDLHERTARCKFIGRLGMTCTLTDGARKFRRWRYCKPWSHLADLEADLSRPWWSGKVV